MAGKKSRGHSRRDATAPRTIPVAHSPQQQQKWEGSRLTPADKTKSLFPRRSQPFGTLCDATEGNVKSPARLSVFDTAQPNHTKHRPTTGPNLSGSPSKVRALLPAVSAFPPRKVADRPALSTVSREDPLVLTNNPDRKSNSLAVPSRRATSRPHRIHTMRLFNRQAGIRSGSAGICRNRGSGWRPAIWPGTA